MKIFVPSDLDEPAEPAESVKAPRKRHPRCVCGCGRAAHWPQDGQPLFHTRLCGYLMAVQAQRQKQAT